MPIITTAVCKDCTATFVYSRVSSRRVFCRECSEVRQLKWRSFRNPSYSLTPKRKLIRYAGFDPTERQPQ